MVRAEAGRYSCWNYGHQITVTLQKFAPLPNLRIFGISRPMNAPHASRTFKSGNSVAVRLHRALGLSEGVEVTTEPLGGGVWIRPKVKRPSLAEMATKLLALGPVGEIERRDTDLPERAGL